MDDLASRKCKPCEGGVDALSLEQSKALLKSLHADWSLSDDSNAIFRKFKFPAFSRTMAFTNAVAWIATVEGHHPEMQVRYGCCRVSYSTNAIGGLSDNDFICAAKVDRLFAEA